MYGLGHYKFILFYFIFYFERVVAISVPIWHRIKMWWVPTCRFTLSSTVYPGLFIPVRSSRDRWKHKSEVGCEPLLHGVMTCAFPILVLWNCSAKWWESVLTNPVVAWLPLSFLQNLNLQYLKLCVPNQDTCTSRFKGIWGALMAWKTVLKSLGCDS